MFSLSMFRFFINSSTRQNIQSHCFNSHPLETTASIPHRIKYQSVWTPGSFVTHQVQIVLIATHSWDNIPWEFPGHWKVLLARVGYMMHYSKTRWMHDIVGWVWASIRQSWTAGSCSSAEIYSVISHWSEWSWVAVNLATISCYYYQAKVPSHKIQLYNIGREV